jgi:hypothetical protein
VSHFCEYDAHTNGRLGIEPCGEPAVGEWYCYDHLGSTEAQAGLMNALDEFEREGEGE